MAQTTHSPQDTQDVDPITATFVRDRQAFWTRFTGFASNAVIALVIILLLMWWFLV